MTPVSNSSVFFMDPTFTSWIDLEHFLTTDKVFDRAASKSLDVVTAVPAYPGFTFNGVDSKVTIGNVGTIKTCMFWIKPNNLTQEIFQLQTIIYLEIIAGEIAANGRGFTPTTFFVDGVEGTTVVQDKWNFVAYNDSAAFSSADTVLGTVNGVGFYDGEISKFITSTAILSAAQILSFYNYYKRFYSLGTS